MSNRLISLFSIGKTQQIGQQTTNNYGLDEEAVKAVIDNTVEELSKELQGVEKNNEALIAGVQNELCRQIFELKKGQTDVCEAVRKNFEYLEANRTKFALQIIETIKESISPTGSMEKALRSFCEQSERAAEAQYERFMEWQEKQIEARRRELFEVTHEENIREELVLFYARKLLELVPGDVLARFYLLVSENNAQTVNAYLDEMDVVLQGKETVCAALDYLLEPLEPRMEPSLRSLAERAFQEGVFKRGEYVRYITAIEGGKSFDPLRQWDLFIAYSSKDRKEVDELVKELEEQEIECFVAYRDLPHGRGAGGQRYWNDLKCAMGNSRGLVFVSTPNSRSRSCDAIEREDKSVDGGMGELPYYGKNFSREEKLRIEYRPESDKNTPTPRSVEQMLKRFFGEVNYCQTPEEVAEVASRYLFPQLYGEEEPAETSEEQRKAEAAKQAEAQRKAEAAAKIAEERKKKPWLASDYPTLEHYDESEFEIEGTKLIAYLKKDFSGEVKIPRGVTSIGNYAFFNCSGLTSITIPEGVTSIGSWAFNGCSGLTSITIPDGVESIGETAFWKCSGLTSIIIPEGVTLIGQCAFSHCSGLTSIKIPASVTSIEECAFSSCSGLTKIEVDENNPVYHAEGNCVIEIKSKTLILGCKASRIPYGVTSIGHEAFYDCSGLTSITIPNSVTSIGNWAFYNCYRLTSITIPDGVKSIGREAFSHCSGLTSITIPASVTSIEGNAFSDCSGLTKIEVDENNPVYHAEGNCLIETASKTLISGCKTSKIPQGVESIGGWAFRDCSGLTAIAIPNSVKSIGGWAFYGCSGLTAIAIPDGVESIGKYAFSECSGLTSITIPASVTSIEGNAFSDCSGLTKIEVDKNNPVYHAEGNCLIETASKTLISGCKTSKIPQGVESIGGWAFRDCSGLTAIIIPEGVTSIGWWAFSGCKKLTIYCEASEQPSGWDMYWNPDDCPVVWGYKKK